ncbi:MAG TPA: sulfatase-like hydrolase/transferase [Vicinamibacteria bacterium]|nr:sulfatase-like hydrolase/transferase [Vicinamibacteria bacterium]
MSRRPRLLLGVAIAALFGASCGLFPSTAPPPPARGVVLVLADGFGGGGAPERTPALAQLAAAGRSFDAAFAPDPEPGAARAALLGTGARSIAALFRARGAAVAGVGAGRALPLDSGEWSLHLPGRVGELPVASRLEGWLRAQSGSFLLVAAVGGEPGPAPGLPPPATIAGQLAPPLPRIAVADLGFSDRPGGETRPPAWSEPARQRAAADHLERALAADRDLASLVALVGRAAPGAAVVVVGDPPPDRGAHGLLTRPDALFDDTLRSRLVVATPGLSRPGKTSRRIVSTLDAAPTLLALAGLAAEPGLAGRSLMPLLADPGAEGALEALSSVARKAGRVGRSARSSRWRYTEWPDGSRELYDHDADPGEITNLASLPEQRATIEKMGRALEPRPPGAEVPVPAGAPRRNVLLILVDDLNTRVGAWGAPVKTPAIDRLAARGVRFDRAYVQVAMCSPSRVSMFTGWRPERTGVWTNVDPPRPEGAVPLQEHFAAHGAVTVAVGKVLHFPENFRWDVREEHPEIVEEEHEARAAGEGVDGLWVKAPGADLDQPDGRRARRAAALLERYRRRPFFLAVGFVRPHVRWIAPARYFGLYPPEAMAPVPFPVDDLADVPAIAVKTKPQPLPGLSLLRREPPGLVPDPALRRQAMAAYQACVSFADAQVGVLLDALDRLDLWRDTVVVLAGDNGFHLGEHGGLLRKDTLFEEALWVPLIVAAPGLVPEGAVVRGPTEILDVYPTLVELAGLPPVAGLDGLSLAPVLARPEAPGRDAAVSYRRVQPPERAFSLRTDTARYTLWPDGSEELYDLRSKAGESENLATRPDRAAEKARLRARLEARVDRIPSWR